MPQAGGNAGPEAALAAARGKAAIWACAIVRVIGWVNFLDGGSRQPYMKLTAIDEAFGVPQSTGQAKSKAIRDLLKIRQFSSEWMLPSLIDQTSIVWMVTVNGFIVDARQLPRAIEEELVRRKLIPHIPGERLDAAETTAGSDE